MTDNYEDRYMEQFIHDLEEDLETEQDELFRRLIINVLTMYYRTHTPAPVQD